MHRVENKTGPPIFLAKLCKKSSHTNPTNFSPNFLVPTLKLKRSSYKIFVPGLLLWNNIMTAAGKSQEILPKLKTTLKEKLQ